MSKMISGLLGISKNDNRERALSIEIGIATLLLVFAGVAGASGVDSVTILSISPSFGTLLTEGQQVNFTVSGNYFLDSADKGEIRLYLQKVNDVHIFNSPVPTYSINRGDGTFTMAQTVIIPSMTQMWLITPLFPEGVEVTNVADSRIFNVTNTITPTPTVTEVPSPTPTPTATPASHFTPEVAAWDIDHDNLIQKGEAVNAVIAYFSGTITKSNAVSVVMAYFSS